MSHFTIVLSAVSTAIGLLVAVLGFVIRATVKWTRVESKLEQVVDHLKLIADQVKDDRHANNERLTYLERSVWPTRQG